MMSSKDIDSSMLTKIIYSGDYSASIYLLIRYIIEFTPPVLVIDIRSLTYVLDDKVWTTGGKEVTPRDIIEKKVESKSHMERIKKCNLKYPIMMHQGGGILDGNHRFAKAYI